jgi:hypothetical protein
VADYRKHKAAEHRATTLQQSQLRGYWEEHHIEGQVRDVLQDIFMEYGEGAARAATNAVMLAKQEPPQPTKPVRAKPVPRTGPLPRELVNLVAFTDLHHVAHAKIATGIEKHWVAVVQGDWTGSDGTQITWALDAFGRYDFYEYFHHVSTFTPCNECPHALV